MTVLALSLGACNKKDAAQEAAPPATTEAAPPAEAPPADAAAGRTTEAAPAEGSGDHSGH